MAKKKIHIFDRGGDFVVDPPMLEITSGGDIVKLVNHTDEDLVWKFDDATVFGAAILEVVPAKKMSNPKNAANGVSASVEYQVLMIKSGKKAKGNSDPSIIIDT